MILLFHCILLISYPGYSQSSDNIFIDSLKQKSITGEIEITEKIDLWNQIAKYYRNIDLDSSSYYAEKAKYLSTEIGYKKGIAVSTFRLAQLEEVKGNYDNALPLFNKTILLYEEGLKKDVNYLQAINYIGIIYEVRNDYDKSLEYYLIGIREAEKQNHKLTMAFFYNNISIIYNYTNFPNKEIQYLRKASKIFKELGQDIYYANSILNIGAYYISVNKEDSALLYFKEAEILQKRDNNYYGLTNLYGNTGNIALRKGNIEDALKDFKESLVNAKLMDTLDPDRKTRISAANLNIGNALIGLKKYSLAREHLYLAYSLGNFLESPRHQKEGSYGLFLCFLGLDNYDSAMYYHSIFLTLNDSLIAETYNEKIDQLNYEYKLEKETELFKKDKELITLKKNRQELIYLSLLGLLFTIALTVVIIYYFQKNKLQKSELKRENLRLEKENLSNVLDKKNRELTANVLNLIERNEFIAKLSEQLQDHANLKITDSSEKIENIIRSIDKDSANKLWKEFEVRYLEVHKDFHQKLTAKYPKLTANERKLCAFIVLNMSTKDISSITYQSNQSIKVARYRLRKKLGLDKNENLTAFLHSL
ncbi:MAG: hypothetical protein DRJ07_19490 [Bacteroidetes bacterium]|nr:MAG: hypothetical protein DRJ07_19490 [Bacteroidota bacterium]